MLLTDGPDAGTRDGDSVPVLPRLAAEKQVLFLGGKGGVGKTTLASAAAYGAAAAGRDVLVISTDPAHNLGHLWEREVGDRRTVLAADLPGRLEGVEIDPEATTARHLEQVGRTMRRLSPEHLAGQIDRHLALVRDTPGTHEAAVLERMTELVEQGRAEFDLVVLDTAPTGHTARLLALPEIMTAWMEGLLATRDRAAGFEEARRSFDDTGERGGWLPGRRGRRDTRAEGDLGASVLGTRLAEAAPAPRADRDEEIRAVLLRRRDRLAGLRALLTDPAACSFAIVLAAERLPVRESIALHRELGELGVDVGGLVVNKRSPGDRGEFLAARRAVEAEHLAELRRALPEVPMQQVALGARDVVGETDVAELSRAMQA